MCYEKHKGATDYADELENYISRELWEGILLGPFQANPFKVPICISPLSSVEKRDLADRRVIMDLSFPPGNSVNDRIPKNIYLGEDICLKYPSIDELVSLIKKKGRGCALFKRDFKRVYKQFLFDPGNLHYLGFKWRDALYFDMTLPMGLRSSAFCCQRVTNAVKFIFEKRGYDLVSYLDDMASAETWEKAMEAFVSLKCLLEEAGLEDSEIKEWAPSVDMLFLGVKFDTNNLTL